MTAEDKKAKMLERVRALLAKADSTNFPAEADSFRDKADKLMTEYAIEQWQVDAAQEGVGKRAQPERRDFDMGWFRTNSRSNDLWRLMQYVAMHCRVKLVHWRYDADQIPAIGLPSDLDYFDMLFTSLMLQMGRGLEPHPSADMTMECNLCMMKEAGMKWERIGELLIGIGQLDHYDRNMGVKFTKMYTDYCRENGRQRLRTTPSVFQRSFAQGFVSEMATRLRHQEESRGTGMELALRDIKDEVDAMANEMFGAAPPPSGRGLTHGGGHVDPAAYVSGAEAGRKAQLAGNPNDTMRRGVAGEIES